MKRDMCREVIEKQAARIAELEAELQHKRRLMEEDAGVLALAIERIAELEAPWEHAYNADGSVTVEASSGVVRGLAEILLHILEQDGGENYCEYRLGLPAGQSVKGVEEVIVLVQKGGAETPASQNIRLKQRIAELEAHLGDLMMAAALLLNYGDDADVLLPNLAAIIGVAEAAMPDWGPNLDAELAKVRARNRAVRAVVDAARGINTDPCRQHPVFTRCMTHGTDAPRDSVTGKPGNCPHARLRTALAELEPPQHTRTVDELFAKPPITMTAEEAAAMGIPSLDDRRF